MKVARRIAVSALLVFALALLMLPATQAGVWNHSTRVNFSKSVQLPGVVLAPGEYRFELLRSPSNRNVVQVFNADHSQVIGTFLTVPVERAQSTGKAVFVLEERPYGEPEAIKEWYYPGELTGDEFIYSRDDSSNFAVAAAPASSDVVTQTETTPAPEQTALAEPAPETRAEDVAAPASQPESSEAAVPQEPQSTAPEEQAAPAETKAAEPAKEEELPATASNLYLFLLIGSLSVLSGVAIRQFAKS